MIKYLLLLLIPIVLIAACTQISAQAPVTTEITKDEISILDDQLITLNEEQLDAISAEDPTFLSDTQDNIASDMSIFFYY
ncbi:MAG: hypothetical protein QXD55_00615 [Candidatus Aenigmatarchaeota archaeon]